MLGRRRRHTRRAPSREEEDVCDQDRIKVGWLSRLVSLLVVPYAGRSCRLRVEGLFDNTLLWKQPRACHSQS